ncbi:MAG: hypothetical protein HKM95_13115 [Inquilinus sp.]|nr:hypothetical protein [Inquilinus sp.]
MPRLTRDLIVIAVTTGIAATLAISFEVGEAYLGWAQSHEDLEFDEFPFVLLALASTVGAIGFWRVLQYRKEYGTWRRELESRDQSVAQLRRAYLSLEEGFAERTQELEEALALRAADTEALRRKDAALAQLDRLSAMETMVMTLAHEVNQPLTAMCSFAQGSLEILRSGSAPPEKLRDALNRILAQGRRASEILVRVRNFAERIETISVAIDIDELVTETAELLALNARHSGVELALELGSNQPTIEADPIQIQQVLVNLALNAMEAMLESGGRLTISTKVEARRYVLIAVSDTGPGIRPDLREKIFEPIFSTKPSGLGMGLAISRSIVQSFDGQLWVEENEVSGGAVFYVRLPIMGTEREDG